MEIGIHTVFSMAAARRVAAGVRCACERSRPRDLHDRCDDRASPSGLGRGSKKSGEQAIGASRGGRTTKIHVRVDALGNPVQLELTEGQRHDYVVAEALTKDVTGANLIADRGYDGDSLLDSLRARDCVAVIPSKKNRKMPRLLNKELYIERHLVECFFQKLKRNRRVATRYEKLATNFLGIVFLAAITLWLA